MRIAVITILAATVLLGACEDSKVDTGVASGAGQGYGQDGMGTGAGGANGRGGVSQEGLGGAGGRGSATSGTLDGSTPDRVFFATDQTGLSAEARAILDRQAGFLSRNPQVHIVIEGHADERGTREYNLALGDRRASATRDYLASRGIAPNRIRTISYGKERPAVVGPSDTYWAKNRRAVTVVQ